MCESSFSNKHFIQYVVCGGSVMVEALLKSGKLGLMNTSYNKVCSNSAFSQRHVTAHWFSLQYERSLLTAQLLARLYMLTNIAELFLVFGFYPQGNIS